MIALPGATLILDDVFRWLILSCVAVAVAGGGWCRIRFAHGLAKTLEPGTKIAPEVTESFRAEEHNHDREYHQKFGYTYPTHNSHSLK